VTGTGPQPATGQQPEIRERATQMLGQLTRTEEGTTP